MTNIMTNHCGVRDFCWLHFSPQVIVPDIENIEFTENIMHRRAHCNRVFIWAACNVTHSQYFKFLPVFNYRTGMAMPWRCQLFQIDTIPIIEIIDMIPILYQGFLVVSILNFNSDTSAFEPYSTVLLSLTHYRFQSGFG